MKIKARLLNKIIPEILVGSGLYHLAKPIIRSMGIIFMLHRVLPNELKSKSSGNRLYEVTPEYLEKSIIYYLEQGYDVISMDELHKRLTSPNGNRKFVAYTFDDGYSDLMDFAYPIFKKYNLPFTLYLASGFPDKSVILWQYFFEEAFHKDKLNYMSSKLSEVANSFCKSENEELINEFREVLINHDLNPSEPVSKLTLEWHQISEMLDSGLLNLGAHTVNHYSLNTLSGKKIEREITESKKTIESRLGISVNHFAYPYGSRESVGEREIKITSRLGFLTSVTTRQALILKKHNEYLNALPRFNFIEFNPGNNSFFKLIESGALQLIANKFRKFVTL